MQLALYEPDIPQNTAAILRTAACFCVPTHVVGPTGFDLSPRAVRRAGLDYADAVILHRHNGWQEFVSACCGRLVLFTTQSAQPAHRFEFGPDDTLVFGSESAGAPGFVHDACHERVRIAMAPGMRSLNLAVAVGIGISTALTRTGILDTGHYS
ncbi:MAG: TrmH family RNA methyltransferase [Pseudomonadota bacterium]